MLAELSRMRSSTTNARVELERREADLALHEEDLARATAERDAALAAFEGLEA